MAIRTVGGGERFVARKTVVFAGDGSASVTVPSGADLARIQPQLFTNQGYGVLVNRETAPTLAVNEIALEHKDALSDAFPATEVIYLQLVDEDGMDAVPGANDDVKVTFYTNIAGRQQRKV